MKIKMIELDPDEDLPDDFKMENIICTHHKYLDKADVFLLCVWYIS